MTSHCDEIEELAGFVADSHFPNDKVDPYKLAEANGISYNFGRYEDAFDGLLEYRDRAFHIYGNADRIRDESYPRARFTFAHELGHYYIDEHRLSLESGSAAVACLTDFQSDISVEREADHFASYLLMPNQRFLSYARTCSKGSAAIRRLADAFGTSLSSTAIRFVRSNVSPVIAMCWTSTSRRWCWSSRDFYDLTKNWAFKDPSRLPREAETLRLLGDPSLTPEPRGTTLSTWFPRVRRGSLQDLIMIEDVLSLGTYGVITLLYSAQ